MEVAVRQQTLCLLLEGGSKLKEPSASDKLYNFKTQFGNFMSLYEWMDKLGKWLLRLPEKDKRYQSWPTY